MRDRLPQRVGVAALLVMAWTSVSFSPSRARAYVVDSERVDAVLSEGGRVVEAAVELSLSDVRDGDELSLWAWGARIEHSPPGTDELVWRWVFPGSESLGRYVVTHVVVDGAPARVRTEGTDAPHHGADLFVPLGDASPLKSVRFSLRIEVPARFGRLGHAGSVTSLRALGIPWLSEETDPS